MMGDVPGGGEAPGVSLERNASQTDRFTDPGGGVAKAGKRCKIRNKFSVNHPHTASHRLQ
jgi:hypothetical protein